MLLLAFVIMQSYQANTVPPTTLEHNLPILKFSDTVHLLNHLKDALIYFAYSCFRLILEVNADNTVHRPWTKSYALKNQI